MGHQHKWMIFAGKKHKYVTLKMKELRKTRAIIKLRRGEIVILEDRTKKLVQQHDTQASTSKFVPQFMCMLKLQGSFYARQCSNGNIFEQDI